MNQDDDHREAFEKHQVQTTSSCYYDQVLESCRPETMEGKFSTPNTAS